MARTSREIAKFSELAERQTLVFSFRISLKNLDKLDEGKAVIVNCYGKRLKIQEVE